jgi:hypothetical protein
MLRRNRCASLLLATSAIVWPGNVHAGETTTYSYDSLGRLIGVGHSGTVNNGVNAAYCYDGADNRARVTISQAAPPCPPPPPPPPLAPPPPPPPVFSISSASANEGSILVFTVTRSGTAAGSYSVGYATASVSATSGSDYGPVSGTLTFAAAGTQTLSVATVADNVAEGAETILMTLSAPTGGAALWSGASQATGTINANAAPPQPGNLPPTAVNDYGMGQRCQTRDFDVTANDSDSDGDVPLTVTALNGDNGFSIVSGSTIRFGYGGAVGSFATVYTVTDARGATATATLYVDVHWDVCE